MKIAIVSDTHGQICEFLRGIENLEVDLIFYLGDVAKDAIEIEKHTKIPMESVLGNNEYFSNIKNIPWVQHLVIDDLDIVLTHGHKYGVYYGLKELIQLGKEHNADYVFYGHTHRFLLEEKEGMIFCNPGSPSFPRDGQKSFVLWDVKKNKINRILL